MGRTQEDSVFVFDEPTIGLHPLDVMTLLSVFSSLIDHGATLIVIEHDLDIIRNADWIVDMGPGGGEEGGRIVAEGTPDDIKRTKASVTGRFILIGFKVRGALLLKSRRGVPGVHLFFPPIYTKVE